MIAREGQLRAVLQDDAILPMKPWLQFLDEIESDDRRAMDTHKLPGIKLRLKTTNRFTKQVSFLAAVDGDIVALRFDPIDFTRFQEVDTARSFDYQTLEIFVARFQFFQQGQDTLVHAAVSVAQELRLGPLPRDIEPFLIEWF